MAAAVIPPELVDRIIDNCHMDLQTLKIWRYVNKDWNISCRYHLFNSIRLDHRTLTPFLNLLASPSGPLIAALVTSLNIQTEDALPLFIAAVPTLSKHLRPTALILSIQNSTEDYEWQFGLHTPPRSRLDTSAFLGCFPSVISLYCHIHCDTFIEAAELITSFPLLETLRFNGAWDTDGDLTALKHLFLPATIEHLRVDMTSAFFLHWFLRNEPPIRPSKLDLDASYGAEAVSYLLRHIGSALEQLNFNSVPYPLEQIDFTHNTKLRSLVIRVWKNKVKTVLRILSELRSSAMEELEFSGWQVSYDEVDETHLWPELDAVLAEPRFSGLQQITVEVSRPHAASIGILLPVTAKRNVLRYRDESRHVYYEVS